MIRRQNLEPERITIMTGKCLRLMPIAISGFRLPPSTDADLLYAAAVLASRGAPDERPQRLESL